MDVKFRFCCTCGRQLWYNIKIGRVAPECERLFEKPAGLPGFAGKTASAAFRQGSPGQNAPCGDALITHNELFPQRRRSPSKTTNTAISGARKTARAARVRPAGLTARPARAHSARLTAARQPAPSAAPVPSELAARDLPARPAPAGIPRNGRKRAACAAFSAACSGSSPFASAWV